MTIFRISYVIGGLESIIHDATTEFKVDKVTFHNREKNENVGTVIIESSESDSSVAEINALFLVDKAIGVLCFAYGIEAMIKPDNFYVTDLTHSPNLTRCSGSLKLRSSILGEDPQLTVTNPFT
ncbi:MAG TPA: hypothetical protein VF884_14410 [Nitrososphaeraceae archaeon]